MNVARAEHDYRDVNLFVVDDDDIDVMTLERSMRRMKIVSVIHRAKNGQEALDILAAGVIKKPFIILLDLNMPKMGGLDFLKIIRADPLYTSIVVFILTTSKSDEDMTRAYRDHVAGYVLKNGVGDSFIDLISMFKCYWKVVEIPVLVTEA